MIDHYNICKMLASTREENTSEIAVGLVWNNEREHVKMVMLDEGRSECC